MKSNGLAWGMGGNPVEQTVFPSLWIMGLFHMPRVWLMSRCVARKGFFLPRAILARNTPTRAVVSHHKGSFLQECASE